MKKITFIFVGIIYVLAIIMVAFLGVNATIHGQTVDVTEIVLRQAGGLEAGSTLTYPEGVAVKDSVFTLYSRPEESEIVMDEETHIGKKGTLYWSKGPGIDFDYIIEVRKFAEICDSSTWRDGKMHFSVEAFVLPEDATKKDLVYTLMTPGGDIPQNATINPSNGDITFLEKYTSPVTDFYIMIKTTDNSMVSCLVNLRIAKYNPA